MATKEEKQKQLQCLQDNYKIVKEEFEELERQIKDPNPPYNTKRWVMNYLAAFGGRTVY